MRRPALVCVLACSLAAACGGTPPTTPSPSDGPSNATGVTQAPASIFGSGTPDLAGCLAAPGRAACFTATRAAALSIVSAATAPGSPGTLSATVTGSSVTLVWSAPTSGDPVVGYVLEAGSGSGSADLANLLTNSTATTFSTSGVPSGTYYVRIKAQSGGGIGPSSNEIIVVVGSTGCTSPPGGPGTLGSSVNGTTVVLSWTAPTGAPTTYIVEAGSSPGSANLAVIDLGSASTTFTAPDVAAGTYYVRLRARNACGTGAASNEVTVIVGGTTPTTPTSLDGSWQGTTSQGRAISLTVVGNKVSAIAYTYSVPNCISSATSSSTYTPALSLTNNAFSRSTPGAGTNTTISGTFGSSSVTGTLLMTFSYIPFVQFCSGTVNITWSATR